MVLSLSRISSLFNGLSHLPHHLAQPAADSGVAAAGASPPPADDPGFLHAGFAPLEPDLTGEIRQALGEEAARREGDVP
jgi:hypothetical protein